MVQASTIDGSAVGDPHVVNRRSVTGRVVTILRAVASTRNPCLTEVARLAGLPTSTTHRLLGELAAGNLVERSDTGRYRLTRMSPPALRADRHGCVRKHVTAAMDDLAAVAGVRVRFGVWHECGVAYLDRAPGPGAPCVSGMEISAAGVLPIHATAVGKALLAYAPAAELGRVVAGPLPAYTARTIVSKEGLEVALAAVRSQGVAVARREWQDDEHAVAVPVFGPCGVIAALELVGTSMPSLGGSVSALVVAARALGRRLAEYPAELPAPVRLRADGGAASLRWLFDPTRPLTRAARRPTA